MKQDIKNIKINMTDLVLEKKISRKIVPRVLKEITMGTISVVDLLKQMNKTN